LSFWCLDKAVTRQICLILRRGDSEELLVWLKTWGEPGIIGEPRNQDLGLDLPGSNCKPSGNSKSRPRDETPPQVVKAKTKGGVCSFDGEFWAGWRWGRCVLPVCQPLPNRREE
jgi:hypothetical protein